MYVLYVQLLIVEVRHVKVVLVSCHWLREHDGPREHAREITHTPRKQHTHITAYDILSHASQLVVTSPCSTMCAHARELDCLEEEYRCCIMQYVSCPRATSKTRLQHFTAAASKTRLQHFPAPELALRRAHFVDTDNHFERVVGN